MSKAGTTGAATIATIMCIAFITSTISFSGAVVADNTAPVTNASVTGTPGSNGWYVSNVSVNLTATDDMSGVNRTLYSLDGSPYASYSSNLTLSDGNHTLLYYSIDNASNSEALKLRNVKVDTIAPAAYAAVKGNLSANGWYNGSAVVNLTATDAGSKLWNITYSLDAGTWTIYTGNLTIGDGQHTLAYRGIDWAGNIGEKELHLDVSDPSIDVILSGTQLPNGWFSTDVMVSLVASGGNGGIHHVEYGFDGRNWTAGQVFWITNEGVTRFYYRAVDNGGNAGSVHSMYVGIDKNSPAIRLEIAGDRASKGWYNSDITITLVASDGGHINHTEYSTDGTHWSSYTEPFKMSWGASRMLHYRTTDMAGNVANGSAFIYFRPMSFNQGAMSGQVYINGALRPTQNPSTSASPTPVPTPRPTPVPTADPSASMTMPDRTSGSGSPLAIAVLVVVLGLVGAAGVAAYLFVFKPK